VSTDDLERFHDIVLRSPTLQAQLRVVVDRPQFASALVALAAANSCVVTLADVEDALADARRAWLTRWV
jgi:hypothetical protein